ncbi:PREDICTED: tankyrase-1-like [Branchiostoma belcheri]|uniref:Tankyrase-1-like n=1 Tax=Branchiostoma belcheri TaxID=7741 RepID=A0A6P5A972_BRABE|nr:PREDICTED: tankyrase-1-like [Branchiostoma belcheri]
MAQNANEALLYAVENGCLDGVKAALKAGADIDYAEDDIDSTGSGLLLASINGDVEMVRLLIHMGASVSKKTGAGISCAPLHGAAGNGHTEVVELLVHHGATLDTRDAYQRTPLMAAILFGHVNTVRQLIEFGARVDLADRRGRTAQEYCMADVVGEDCGCVRRELMKLVQQAIKTKMLRCCNPTCGKAGRRSTLKLCAQCKLTRYCSRDCQKQHWTVGHKKSCRQDTCTVTDAEVRKILKTIQSTAGEV